MLEVQFLRLLDRAEPRISRTLVFPTVRLPTCVHAHNVFVNRSMSAKYFPVVIKLKYQIVKLQVRKQV